MAIMDDGWCRAEYIPKEWEGRHGWRWFPRLGPFVESCIIPRDFDRNQKVCGNMHFKLRLTPRPPEISYVWEAINPDDPWLGLPAGEVLARDLEEAETSIKNS